MSGVKRELEQLLDQDFDKKEVYDDEEEVNAEGLDDIDSLYSPSVNAGDNQDDHYEEETAGDQDILDEEGDVILERPKGTGENPEENNDPKDVKRGWPASRMKRKTPPEDVVWEGNDSYLT